MEIYDKLFSNKKPMIKTLVFEFQSIKILLNY